MPILENTRTGPPTSSVLSFSHLTYEVPLRGGAVKKLLDDVSVEVKVGELLAIMGPSGAGKADSAAQDENTLTDLPRNAGKSTLLDVMAFRKIATGDYFVGPEDIRMELGLTRTGSLGSLPMLPRKDVVQRVNRVMTALGLQSCADQHIGTPISRGISGGASD
ncbi:hypothetical protein DXG03_001241 [Asterophora parasitica]|uniref:ABC transporter domain-containing protein n=1 Tax=Asterophora parasitica TaxID=117018 RepID=A0A9P7KBP2_9AGAR|nr:hypothetical protein DXG03_001241 [Asterophora parasitica]